MVPRTISWGERTNLRTVREATARVLAASPAPGWASGAGAGADGAAGTVDVMVIGVPLD
jgi:hypothetical protein